MSKINPKRAYAKEIIENFADIGERGASLSEGEHTPVNFRICEDGALEKRCGWRVYESFDEGELRGLWQGVLKGETLRFAVCGSRVLRLQTNRRTTVATLSTQTGNVQFFVFCNTLYLLDGNTVRVWDDRILSFRMAEGYAPLYGRGWHPVEMGNVNEPLNVFTNRVRIQYYTREPTTFFRLPFYAKSVDSVRADGYLTTAYSFSPMTDSITLSQAASSLVVAFTIYMDSDTQSDLHSATSAHTAYPGSAERLLLYGTPRGQYLYVGTEVSDIMLAASRADYQNSDRLYFCESDVMIVGDSDNPITTVCRDRQQLLAFHASGAAVIRFPEDDVPQYYALSGIPGCTVRNMDVSVNGSRYILNKAGLFRLTVDSTSPDEIKATPIKASLPLSDSALLSRMQVAYHPAHGEIWLIDPEDADGCVRIYCPNGNKVYRFDNVRASRAITVDGLFGFLSGNDICVFEEHLKTDNGSPFLAVATTGWLHFGTPERSKRSLRASLLAQHAEDLTLTLESEQRQCEIDHTACGISKHLLDARVSLGRFRLLRAVIRDAGESRPRITRLALYANL